MEFRETAVGGEDTAGVVVVEEVVDDGEWMDGWMLDGRKGGGGGKRVR